MPSMSGITLQAAAKSLGGEVRGDEILAPGPAHSKQDRSMSVRFDKNAPEGFLINSFSGDDPLACRDHVRACLGRSEWQPHHRTHEDEPPDFSLRDLGMPSAVWRYTHADGRVAGVVARYEIPQGKTIRPWIESGGRWKSGAMPEPRPLYRLPELLTRPDVPVLVVEGEKSADAAARLFPSHAVTTSPGGSKAASKADWFALRGRDVTIWPDNDSPGMQYAVDVERLARAAGAHSVTIVDIPQSWPPAFDLADQLPDGVAVETLMAMLIAPATAGVGNDNVAPLWGDPEPIDAPLLPVPQFEAAALLPDALRDWVMDAADRMPCAPDYVAASAIVAAATVIGARCAIRPKELDDWAVVPNLWGGIVGTPSQKKSPAIGEGMKALDQIIAKARRQHEQEAHRHCAEKIVFEAHREALEADIKAAAKGKSKSAKTIDALAIELEEHNRGDIAEPSLRRFKTNDTTIEKLGELLRDNPAGMLVLRDELVGLLASWEKDGREGDRAFFLEAWNGSSAFDTDRIIRNSVLIENLCVSIFGGIQPDKLTAYLEQAANALGNDGMLQRFQVLVYPDPIPWAYRDKAPNKTARERAYAVYGTLSEFIPSEWGAMQSDDDKFPYFRFSNEAQEIYVEWSHDLHAKIDREGNPLISQHLAKYDKLFPALALIFHLISCADAGQHGPVNVDAALMAAAWCDYLEPHARRCYGLLADNGLRAAQALAERVKEGALKAGFTSRDVRRNQWRYLTTDELVSAALEWLEDCGWLKSEVAGGTGPGSGRRTLRYSINPVIGGA